MLFIVKFNVEMSYSCQTIENITIFIDVICQVKMLHLAMSDKKSLYK